MKVHCEYGVYRNHCDFDCYGENGFGDCDGNTDCPYYHDGDTIEEVPREKLSQTEKDWYISRGKEIPETVTRRILSSFCRHYKLFCSKKIFHSENVRKFEYDEESGYVYIGKLGIDMEDITLLWYDDGRGVKTLIDETEDEG